MKNLINKYLPATVASKIIETARWVKKKNRQMIRLYRFGNKPFFKEIITKDGNFNIQLQPTKNGCIDETIVEQGFWESELSEQLIKNLKPGDTFLDIGANIGYHSLLISAVSERNVTVHAFEPITNLFNQIEQSRQKNNFTNLTIHNFGLGDKESQMQIYVRDENMGGSSLFEYKNLNLVRPSEASTISIKTLDSVFNENEKVDVIKIDVEGYEFEALKGSKKTLRRNSPIIFMEFSPIMYEEDYSGKTKEFIAYLTDLGYSFYTLDEAGIDLIEWLKGDKRTQIDLKCVNSRKHGT